MTTIIDNNQRKFLVLKTSFENNEEFKIFEYWNRKLKRCSKKHLNEMFVANQINHTIK